LRSLRNGSTTPIRNSLPATRDRRTRTALRNFLADGLLFNDDAKPHGALNDSSTSPAVST
jgi:hypothetical protein